MSLILDDVDRLTGGRIGKFDVACPLCAPGKSTHGQRRKVLRIWRLEPGFATFHCERCGESGYARRDGARSKVDQRHIDALKAAADERDEDYALRQSEKAQALWNAATRGAGSPLVRYLAGRGITCPIPKTIRYLPARNGYDHAMIAAFGLWFEDQDGNVAEPTAVSAVHLTLLNAAGTGKADVETNKKFIGSLGGRPIVLAPPPDGHSSLAITEGIEDGLSAYQALGVAVWAAGSAGNMPKLASHVPAFTECATIFAHPDESGQRGAKGLADRLVARGIPEVLVEGLNEA